MHAGPEGLRNVLSHVVLLLAVRFKICDPHLALDAEALCARSWCSLGLVSSLDFFPSCFGDAACPGSDLASPTRVLYVGKKVGGVAVLCVTDVVPKAWLGLQGCLEAWHSMFCEEGCDL